jgi:hypothetical protein
MADSGRVDRAQVAAEMDTARQAFHDLLKTADGSALARPSEGTRWTNEQLLYHMMFGYLVVRVLLVPVRAFGVAPRWTSRAFAAVLNAGTVPFHGVNYWGSVLGARVIPARRLAHRMDVVIAALQRQLAAETDSRLRRGMCFPIRWDPYFAPYMTLAQVYHFPTQHFEHHRRQLTL